MTSGPSAAHVGAAGNTVSVSWGDHVEWGMGSGRLATPQDIAQSVALWRQHLAADTVLWREHRTIRALSRFFRHPGATPRHAERQGITDFDEHQAAIDAAHDHGMRAFVYTTIGFDEGWPLELDWWGGIDARQSKYVLFHPDHQMVDRQGKPHHGVLCLSYEEARDYIVGKVRWLVSQHAWDGVFLCTRSQSRPAAHGDRYGFNRPIVDAYRQRYGVDITVNDFDLEAWRRLRGSYLTELLREVRAELNTRGVALSVGIPRSDYLGPPVGNLHLDWRTWLTEGLVDELVVDQVAAVCPSTWLTMWPRDKGYGYLDHDLPRDRASLSADLATRWGPAAVEANVAVSVARMWDELDLAGDTDLAAIDGVRGAVYSSFRWARERGDATRGLWPG